MYSWCRTSRSTSRRSAARPRRQRDGERDRCSAWPITRFRGSAKADNESSLPIQSNPALNAKKQDEGSEDREAGQHRAACVVRSVSAQIAKVPALLRDLMRACFFALKAGLLVYGSVKVAYSVHPS